MLEWILFDLDNTLYPKSMGIFERVVERIRSYMEVRLGYEKELARRLRREYVEKYGSTLRGLMIHQQVDPEEYLEYVHDVGVERQLSPNPLLDELLASIPCAKAIFTSGHRPHALRVLRCLGIESHFPRIFDITFTNYIPKPNPEPYRQILDVLGAQGRECMMVEDLPENLRPAKALGMITVLVGWSPEANGSTLDGVVDHEIEEILKLQEVLNRLAVRQRRGGGK